MIRRFLFCALIATTLFLLSPPTPEFGRTDLMAGPTLTELLKEVESALGREQWNEALALLDQARRGDEDLYRLNNLPYLEAVILQKAGRHERAFSLFNEASTPEFPLQDSLLLHRLQASQGQSWEVRSHLYEQFLNEYPSHPQWGKTAFEYAGLLESRAEKSKAAQWFSRLVEGRGKEARPAEFRLIRLTSPADTEIRLRRLIAVEEGDDIALQAARELHRLQPPTALAQADLRQRGLIFLNNRELELGRRYLELLLKKFPHNPRADQDAYLLARSHTFDGNINRAIQLYEEVYRSHPAGRWGIYSKYLTGNMHLRLKQYAQAADAYRFIIDKHASSDYVGNAYFNLIDAQRWMGRHGEARQTARHALSLAAPKERDRFRYTLAMLDLEGSRWSSALEQLHRLDHLNSAQLPSGVTREEIYYWKGMALQELNESETAATAWREAALGSPNYFAYLARQRLAKGGRSLVDGPSDTDRIAGAWQKALPQARPLFRSAAEREDFLQSDPVAVRLAEMMFLGLYEEAYWETRGLPASRFGGEGNYLYVLAYLAQRGHLPAESVRAADSLRRSIFPRLAPEHYPALLRSLLYPRHYWGHVELWARRFGLEPYLVLALIQQESGFQRDAKSIASARGLMQIMPSTGRRLAGQLNITPFEESDLYRPEIAIHLGTFHFSDLVQRLGSPEKALAAYNGGADNVERWAQKTQRGSPDFFVANIGFRETKLYVLRVMGNYYAYRSIYEGD